MSLPPKLSSRYYNAELFFFSLGGILILARIFGIEIGTLPGLDVSLVNPADSFRVIALLQIATFAYMYMERNQAMLVGNLLRAERRRFVLDSTLLVLVMLIAYPLIFKGSRYEHLSPWWMLAFFALSFAFSLFLSSFLSSLLFIRTSDEAKKLDLPRIPIATGSMLIAGMVVVPIFVVVAYIMWRFVPSSSQVFVGWISGAVFMFTILGGVVSFFSPRRIDNKSQSTRQFVYEMKKTFNQHDYLYKVMDTHFSDKGNRLLHMAQQCASSQDFQKIAAAAAKEAVEKASTGRKFSLGLDTPISFTVNTQEIATSLHADVPKRSRMIEVSRDQKPVIVSIVYEDEPNKTHKYELSGESIQQSFDEMMADDALRGRFIQAYTDMASAIATGNKKDIQEKEYELHGVFDYALRLSFVRKMKEKCESDLFKPAFDGDCEALKRALAKAADVNEIFPGSGWTPLLHAVTQGHYDAAKLLLEHGADPDIQNYQGVSAFLYAVRYGNLKLAKLLYAYKANINLQDNYGDTPLTKAVITKNYACAEWLITIGADVTTINKRGLNALQLAECAKQGALRKKIKTALEKHEKNMPPEQETKL